MTEHNCLSPQKVEVLQICRVIYQENCILISASHRIKSHLMKTQQNRRNDKVHDPQQRAWLHPSLQGFPKDQKKHFTTFSPRKTAKSVALTSSHFISCTMVCFYKYFMKMRHTEGLKGHQGHHSSDFDIQIWYEIWI